MSDTARGWVLHITIIVILFFLYGGEGDYHTGNISRIMVFAVYAMGYNFLFGYTGLLSLGHALFFAAGMYGLGLAIHVFELPTLLALFAGIVSSILVAAGIGALALRTTGVAFMIVTLMFAQAGYLIILYFGKYTRGDEGFNLAQNTRELFGYSLGSDQGRYFAALILFSICFLATFKMVRSSFGRTLIAIRENEQRAIMLGYDTAKLKLQAIIVSGLFSGLAGAAYALLFGYVGATFATVQYSIFPLLWVLLGGAGTTIGPLIGVAFMFYLIDFSSNYTSAYMLIAGVVLVLLTLFAPQGIAGEIRRRFIRWLP